MANTPRATITYPNFMLSSSVKARINVASEETFLVNLQRILNNHSAKRVVLFHDRLIHERVDLLPIVPADRAGRGRQIHHREFFLWVYPPIGATGAGPGELPDRSHHPHHTGRGAHRQPEAEAVIGAGRIGVADEIFDVGAELV